ncbi:MAG: SH3 domain-containing protein, partial [Mesorhizobium sp.]|nr:SH3 domain-containing protein [Mesorhizobium sp.]
LAARFGDAQQAPASPADEKSVAAVRKAMQEAYGNATGDEGSIPAEGTAQNPETDGAEATGSAAATVPLPTPRPDGTGKDIARVDPAAPSTQGAAPISGDILCARYIGQPMTRCSASVTRNGDGSAAVTVTWPDGGTRTINFRDRKPASSDSTGEFRFTREGTLNMIRIGPSERFEIVDALPFGG